MRLHKDFLLEHYSLYEASKKKSGMGIGTAAMIGLSGLLAGNLLHNVYKNRVTAGENTPKNVTGSMTPEEISRMMQDMGTSPANISGSQGASTETPSKTVSTPPVKPAIPAKTVKQVETEKKPIEFAHDTIKKMVIQDEGIKTKMYTDTSKIKTIGVGHNLENEKQSKQIFSTAFGDQGQRLRNHVLSGGQLSTDQVNTLFNADYNLHLERAQKLIPNLHEHPPDVQAALVSGTFRGHVADSPTFLKHFNAGRYKEAAKEFLNRKEYTDPERNSKGELVAPGVITRLEKDHKILSDYAETKTK